MATYVQLGAVKTWYDEHGQGGPLVLLHGGLVDARFFEPNLAPLAERFHVYTPERRGHGHTPDVPGPITYQLMTDDTIASWRPWSGSRRTWSDTATAPSSRCWWRSSVRSW
jgi:pimeloyl-ACP methyl ester carboxylesterase